MGGFGSTRWNDRPVRPLAERSMPLALDDALRQLHQQAERAAPDWQRCTFVWSRGGQRIAICTVSFVCHTDEPPHMRLDYEVGGEAISEVIPIEMADQHFGQRTWWHCPGCARRCVILYRPRLDQRWWCRRCHNVSYQSSRNSDKQVSRMIARGNFAAALNQILSRMTPGDLERLRKILARIDQDSR